MSNVELFIFITTAFFFGVVVGIMWSNNEREYWTKEEVEKAIKHIKRKFGI